MRDHTDTLVNNLSVCVESVLKFLVFRDRDDESARASAILYNYFMLTTRLIVVGVIALASAAAALKIGEPDADGDGPIAWIVENDTIVTGNHTEHALHKVPLHTALKEHTEQVDLMAAALGAQRQQGNDRRSSRMRSLMEQIAEARQHEVERRQEIIRKARDPASNTWMGVVFVPVVLIVACVHCCCAMCSPAATRTFDNDMSIVFHRAAHEYAGEFRFKDAADIFLARVPLKPAER